MLLFPAACCRSRTFVCTGQRLVRARVVLWCTSGLISMKHFATVPSDMVAVYFFHLYSVFSGMFFFGANPGFVSNKKKRQHVWYVWYVCTSVYILYVYITRHDATKILQQCTAVLLHVVGTQVDKRFSILLCVCTYQVHIKSYILCNNKQQQQ